MHPNKAQPKVSPNIELTCCLEHTPEKGCVWATTNWHSARVFVRVPPMQLGTYSGLQDLLTGGVVPKLSLQDLQALSGCCQGFRSLVDAVLQQSWLTVARCVAACSEGLNLHCKCNCPIDGPLCGTETPFLRSIHCVASLQLEAYLSGHGTLPGFTRVYRMAQSQSRV